jgi:hypothetical protein
MVKWLGWVPVGQRSSRRLHSGRTEVWTSPRILAPWSGVLALVLEVYLKRHPKKEQKPPSQKRKKADDNENDGDDDGADTLKPKPPKGNKTMTTKPMAVEQVEEDGYELREIEINDNFNAPALVRKCTTFITSSNLPRQKPK